MRRLTRVLRLAAVASLAAAAACASAAPPPGGHPDEVPPALVSTSPESGAVNVRARSLELRFNETIAARDAAQLSQLIVISPLKGSPKVSWRRTAIRVEPSGGFSPNVTYSVTLLPGVTDLRNNASTDTRVIVFSTGPEFARYGILGRMFDWGAGHVAPNGFIQAISRADSSVYIATTDSAGAFTLGPLPQGVYSVVGFVDQNRNRARDRLELWDSTQVVVATSRPLVELLAIQRDTLPPKITVVSVVDSLTIRAAFDHPLEPRQQFLPSAFTLVGPDSVALAIATVSTQSAADRARADSLRARQDSARAPGRGAAAAPEPIKPSIPSPPSALELGLAPSAVLRPGATYRLTARGLRGITGLAVETSRTFDVRVPAAAPADSAARAVPAPTAPRPRPTRP